MAKGIHLKHFFKNKFLVTCAHKNQTGTPFFSVLYPFTNRRKSKDLKNLKNKFFFSDFKRLIMTLEKY